MEHKKRKKETKTKESGRFLKRKKSSLGEEKINQDTEYKETEEDEEEEKEQLPWHVRIEEETKTTSLSLDSDLSLLGGCIKYRSSANTSDTNATYYIVSIQKLQQSCSYFDKDMFDIKTATICKHCLLPQIKIHHLQDDTKHGIFETFLRICHNPFLIMQNSGVETLLHLYNLSVYFNHTSMLQHIEQYLLKIQTVCPKFNIVQMIVKTLLRMPPNTYSLLYCHLINLLSTALAVYTDFNILNRPTRMNRAMTLTPSGQARFNEKKKRAEEHAKQFSIVLSLPLRVKDHILYRLFAMGYRNPVSEAETLDTFKYFSNLHPQDTTSTTTTSSIVGDPTTTTTPTTLTTLTTSTTFNTMSASIPTSELVPMSTSTLSTPLPSSVVSKLDIHSDFDF